MKNPSRQILLIIIFVGILFSLAFIFPFHSGDSPESGLSVPDKEKAKVNPPVRISIPKINIDAKIEYVGITLLGAMGAPKTPSEVGWYRLGPRPGEEGSAVIDGHSGWKNNIPAVFDNLHKLEKGDKIYVEDEKGETITFIVREIRTYTPKQDAADVFGSTDGKSHLNLITCTGFWDSILKTHTNRLIVFTDRE